MTLAMTARYCCTALPRSYTPDQPASRAVELSAFNSVLPAGPGDPDSRYTSARTEDLREIQQIFHGADLVDNRDKVIREKARSLHSPKHPLIVGFLRQKLSRHKSKSASVLTVDPNQIQRTKNELRKTLLSSNGPEAGGYDEDAPVLEDVEASIAPLQSEESMLRGRGKIRVQDVQGILSSSSGDQRLV